MSLNIYKYYLCKKKKTSSWLFSLYTFWLLKEKMLKALVGIIRNNLLEQFGFITIMHSSWEVMNFWTLTSLLAALLMILIQ